MSNKPDYDLVDYTKCDAAQTNVTYAQNLRKSFTLVRMTPPPILFCRLVRISLVAILLGSGFVAQGAVADRLEPQMPTTQTSLNSSSPPTRALPFRSENSLPRSPKTQKPQSGNGFVESLSYTATKGEGRAQGGAFDYLDNTGIQLTDGFLGGDDVFSDFYEWVAWGIAQPKISFLFSQPVNIRRIEVHLNRNDKAAISLPTTVIINGVAFKVSPDKIPDKTSRFISFDGKFVGREVVIQITRGKGWVFIDEVRFLGAK